VKTEHNCILHHDDVVGDELTQSKKFCSGLDVCNRKSRPKHSVAGPASVIEVSMMSYRPTNVALPVDG
jgi:hypothetical protein